MSQKKRRNRTARYFYKCNTCKRTYSLPGLALLHETAYGHTSFKIVVFDR